MKTKLATLLEFVESGDWENVFRIASKFPRLGDERGAILDAWTAYQNPRFLKQIGKDPESAIQAGKIAIMERYGNSGE